MIEDDGDYWKYEGETKWTKVYSDGRFDGEEWYEYKRDSNSVYLRDLNLSQISSQVSREEVRIDLYLEEVLWCRAYLGQVATGPDCEPLANIVNVSDSECG